MFDFQWLTRWLVSLGKNYYRLVIVCLLNCDLDLYHDRDYHGFLTFFCVCDHEILKNYKKVAENYQIFSHSFGQQISFHLLERRLSLERER